MVDSKPSAAAESSAPHITERRYHQNFSTGEMVMGMVWLSLAALLSVLLEVVYLGTWIGGIAVPYTIPIAFLFNWVLSKTALLWSKKTAIAGIPLYAWITGFLILTFWVGVTGDQLVGSSIRSILLLFAGIAGGAWPLIFHKHNKQGG